MCFLYSFQPEMQAQCTLINFTVTRDGLEDQLLAEVVRAERPDLEQLKVKLCINEIIWNSNFSGYNSIFHIVCFPQGTINKATKRLQDHSEAARRFFAVQVVCSFRKLFGRYCPCGKSWNYKKNMWAVFYFLFHKLVYSTNFKNLQKLKLFVYLILMLPCILLNKLVNFFIMNSGVPHQKFTSQNVFNLLDLRLFYIEF